MLVGQLVLCCDSVEISTDHIEGSMVGPSQGRLVQTFGVALLSCGRRKSVCSTVTLGCTDMRCSMQAFMPQRPGGVALICHVQLFSLDVVRCGYDYGGYVEKDKMCSTYGCMLHRQSQVRTDTV